MVEWLESGSDCFLGLAFWVLGLDLDWPVGPWP